jgi:hypothetical protein
MFGGTTCERAEYILKDATSIIAAFHAVTEKEL